MSELDKLNDTAVETALSEIPETTDLSSELDTHKDTSSIQKYMDEQQTKLQDAIKNRGIVREALYLLKRRKLELENAVSKATSNINFLEIEVKKATNKYFQVRA